MNWVGVTVSRENWNKIFKYFDPLDRVRKIIPNLQSNCHSQQRPLTIFGKLLVFIVLHLAYQARKIKSHDETELKLQDKNISSLQSNVHLV